MNCRTEALVPGVVTDGKCYVFLKVTTAELYGQKDMTTRGVKIKLFKVRGETVLYREISWTPLGEGKCIFCFRLGNKNISSS